MAPRISPETGFGHPHAVPAHGDASLKHGLQRHPMKPADIHESEL